MQIDHRSRTAGLLRGQRRATVLIRPVAPDTGIRFVRCDVPGGPGTFPVRIEYLGTDGASATLERPSGVGISAVGPLLAGLAARGIDNAEVRLDGPEAVLPDDGAAAFVEALRGSDAEDSSFRRTAQTLMEAMI